MMLVNLIHNPLRITVTLKRNKWTGTKYKILKKIILSYKVSFSSNSLIKLFSDLKEYAKVHPLILKVKKIEIEQNKYLIIEKPFKYIPIRIRYFATVNSNENGIEYLISNLPLTKLRIKYNILSSDIEESEIQCSIELDSKLIGKSILFRKLIKAQNELMASLNNIVVI